MSGSRENLPIGIGRPPASIVTSPTSDEPPASNEPTVNTEFSPIAVDDQITLQVGERTFTTARATLVEGSGYFASLLSGRWNDGRKDRPCFVDADGDLFEHVLRYLRRGILPIFYDRSKGHDHARYLALLEEANYFQIDRLVEWIQKKQFLSAIKVQQEVQVVYGTDDLYENGNTEFDVEIYPTWWIKEVYTCPRGIPVHRGKPGACGQACMKALGDADNVFEAEHVLRTVVVRKRVFLDHEACLSGR